MKTKLFQFLIITLALHMMNFSSSAQTTALDQLITEKSEISRESEQSSDSLKKLNEEKKQLIDQLVEVNQKYDKIMETQTQKKELAPINISVTEIAQYLVNKRMGRCNVTHGEYPGEYIIQKDKIKIRFAFLPKESTLAPKLSLAKGEHGEELLQLEQPGYDAYSVTQKGEVQATIRFRLKADNKPGDVAHSVFMGQRIHDKWFGQSSFALTNITCVLGQ